MDASTGDHVALVNENVPAPETVRQLVTCREIPV